MPVVRSAPSTRVSLALVLAASTVHAQQQSDPTALPTAAPSRPALLEQARRAALAHDDRAALDALEQAGRLRMDAALRLRLALAHERLGHLGDALTSADTCALEGAHTGPGAGRARIVAACERLGDSLRDRVGYVSVEIRPPGVRNVHVRIGDVDVPPSVAAAPTVATPGTVTVEVTADGYASEHRAVPVTVGHTTAVTIGLTSTHPANDAAVPAPETAPVAIVAPRATIPVPPLRVPSPVVEPPTDVLPPPFPSAPDREQPPVSLLAPLPSVPSRQAPVARVAHASNGPGAGPWIVVGAGGASLVASVVLYVLQSNAVAGCTVGASAVTCPDSDSLDRARGANGLGIGGAIALGGGIAAVAGGLVWWLVGTHAQHAHAPVVLGPRGIAIVF